MGEVLSFLKPSADNPKWNVARDQRLETDGHRCQAFRFDIGTECGPWPGIEVHHRLPRGRGGSNRQDNLITLCSGHHRWVESNRAEAYELGLLLRSEHPADHS